jgi:hypothetical protein
LRIAPSPVCDDETFLRRVTLRRRRNTSSDKELPPVSVVAARMKEIQAVIAAGPVGGQPVGQPQGYELDDRALMGLRRLRVGRLSLTPLPEGQWRFLLLHERF